MNELLSYIKKLQEILRLQDWDITLILFPTMSGEGATKTIYNDFQAVMEIRADMPIEIQKFTIIHEMVHLVFRDSEDLSREYIKNDDIQGVYQRREERAIEQTAKAIFTLLEGHRPNNWNKKEDAANADSKKNASENV